ncbi:T-box-containing protein TBX6L isoform X2 [Cardiocondyla obscurior]|uniref:T-box-containing protein TBX6L isoform X2 n=1 Tax=Cardiocondyla obscurior TaxID=286306 RepID=UPI0039656398
MQRRTSASENCHRFRDPRSTLVELNVPRLQQLVPPLHLARSSIALHCGLDDRMNSNEWLFRPPVLPGVNVELLNRSLWERFHEQNTEMIITKTGRRMFPSVHVNVSGLRKRESYYVLLEIAPASDRRHKYCGYENGSKMGWSIAGPAEPQHPFNRRIYMHPESPAMGHHWMDNSINFHKLKITNNMNDKNNNVVLTSMHKYVPKIWIIQCSSAKNYSELFSYPAASFAFPETEFIAVTAYQNENITKLKIDNNPFAKGFRETGQSRFKRKYHQISPDSSRDERSNVSFSDSESNQVVSERGNSSNERDSVTSSGDSVTSSGGSIASNSESTRQQKRLVVEESNSEDIQDDAVPDDPKSPAETGDEHRVPLHRPWLNLPPEQVTPSDISRHSHSLSQPLLPPYYNYMYSQYVASQNYMRLRDYPFQNYYRPLWWL